MAAGIPGGERPPTVRVADEPLFDAVREVPDDLRPATCDLRRRSLWSAHAFTLVELIAVIAIIAIFTGVIGVALRNAGSETVGLQSAQRALVGLVNLARGHAAVSGNRTGVFLDVATTVEAWERSHRYFVVAEEAGGSWRAINDGMLLPSGCYALGQDPPIGDWVEDDWGTLCSAGLDDGSPMGIARTVADDVWSGIVFSPRGTVSGGGRIVLCMGQPQAPGSAVPVVFKSPQNVRGMIVYSYGQAVLADGADELR